MRILIDMGHPAHVHFYRNFIKEMEKRGHEFKVAVRVKNPMLELLEYYGIPYEIIGFARSGLTGKALGLPRYDARLLAVARKFKPDVLTGIGSPYIAHVAKLVGRPSYIFTDTEHAVLINRLAVPFATKVFTPDCFMGDFGGKHVRYAGYHELAYLHPKRFNEKGIGKDNIIIRLSSWEASHDRGRQVIEDIVFTKLSDKLREYGNVVMSREDGKRMTLEGKLYEPWQLHAIMKNAKLYIGDGATMATESALLGVPAIYVSPLAGTMGNHENLEGYGLMLPRKMLPSDNTITSIIETPKATWKENRQKMLKDKIDVTSYMIEFFEGLE
jgi:uncharacterized protein